jgi:CrcB protein
VSEDPDPPADSELNAERSAPAAPASSTRPSPADVGLVTAGGAFGTGLRYGVTLAVPVVQGIPVAIFGINVVGAFVLGVLLETLAELGADHGLGRRLRLGLGTGVLGGFTTYSTLATDDVTLALLHGPGAALGFGVATVLVGAVASIAGIVLARRMLHPRIRRHRVIS